MSLDTSPEPYTAGVFAADVFTSAVVGCAVAAPVTIIDYSIMMKVSGNAPSIAHGIKDGFRTMLLRPHHFFRAHPSNQYALIYGVVTGVYFLTYLTSNMTKHIMESRGYSSNEVHWGRGVVTGINNTLLTMMKDAFILRRLPSTGAAASTFVPMVSRIGFCVRDMVTCISAFTLVPMACESLNRRYDGGAALPFASNNTVSAIVVPASMQIVTTVLHIGCIRYQRTYPNPSWLDLKKSLQADYVGSVAARVARIVPAFGIGGLGNAQLLDTTTRWVRDTDRKKVALVKASA